MSFEKIFLDSAISRFKYYKQLGENTFDQLDKKDFHFQTAAESNSIAIIIQHMHGNMLSRWTDFLTSDGEKTWRQRDKEFSVQKLNHQQLLSMWKEGWKCCLDALEALSNADLVKIIYIRNEPLSVIDAINRQLAHYAYHVGQIIFTGKIIKNKDWKNLSIPKGG